MTIVAAVVVWFSLDALHVFAKIKDQVQQLGGEKSLQAVVEYLKLSRAVSLATVVAGCEHHFVHRPGHYWCHDLQRDHSLDRWGLSHTGR